MGVGVVLLFQALACGLPGGAPAPGEAGPVFSESVRAERERERARLGELKQERFRALSARLDGSAGEERAGLLLQISRLATRESCDLVFAELRSTGRPQDEDMLLNALLGRCPRSWADVLLERTHSPLQGHGRRAAQGLAFALGREATPRLREMLATEEHPYVRQTLQIELLRLGDRETADELLSVLQSADVATPEGMAAAHGAVGVALEAPFREAAPTVRELHDRSVAANSDFSLRQLSLTAALWLSDLPAAERAIAVLKRPDDELAYYAEQALQHVTRQEFGLDHAAWHAWWEGGGNRTPLYRPPDADEAAELASAAFAWGIGEPSGPFVEKRPVYWLSAPFYWAGAQPIPVGWHRDVTVLDGTKPVDLRVYDAIEMELLGKPVTYGFLEMTTNGTNAGVVLTKSFARMKNLPLQLELVKENGQWRVGAAEPWGHPR